MPRIDQLSVEAQVLIDKLQISPGAIELLRTTCLFAHNKISENHVISSSGILFAAVGIGKALQHECKGPFSESEKSALDALATVIPSERELYTSRKRGLFYKEIPVYPAIIEHGRTLQFSENVSESFKRLEGESVDVFSILIELLYSPKGWLKGRLEEFGPEKGKFLHDAIVNATKPSSGAPPLPPRDLPPQSVMDDAEPPPKQQQSCKIFISYSHRDKNWLELLQVFLQPLQLHIEIESWDDTRIEAGTRWRNEIKRAMEEAEVAILLLSPYFLASRFIAQNELPPLLEAARHANKRVIPVILNHAYYAIVPELSEFQSINPPSIPLSGMTEEKQAETLTKLVKTVHTLILQQTS